MESLIPRTRSFVGQFGQIIVVSVARSTLIRPGCLDVEYKRQLQTYGRKRLAGGRGGFASSVGETLGYVPLLQTMMAAEQTSNGSW